MTLEGRIARNVGMIVSPRGFAEADELARLGAQAGRHRARIAWRNSGPTASLVLEAIDEYWGGRPPVQRHALRRGAGSRPRA